MVERSTRAVTLARDTYSPNIYISRHIQAECNDQNSQREVLERSHHTSMTAHAPQVDNGEHKRADAPPAWLFPDKQAIPRLPHALYLLYCDGNPSYTSLRITATMCQSTSRPLRPCILLRSDASELFIHQRMIQYTETELDLGHPLRIKTGQEARL